VTGPEGEEIPLLKGRLVEVKEGAAAGGCVNVDVTVPAWNAFLNPV